MSSLTPIDADGTLAERILRHASELFAQRGWAATSLREIAEAAGCTKPALYYHWGN
ncbi:MAG: TetR family transcriptional regulator, partial [Actinobacteria bacterium]|nr:helix-turn-helix transcriptional regulator [Actinomycetota bacterium]NIS35501.1 helix-turn-helix transcriptional regulator [Actinomycetota bacterium]NIU70162.1 helix-turn-helix transcriptional regulator [Actinomycetota bacterium]NIW32047.1 TetR family transcriptional regulator [Actinomycetota bacterium]NIX24287.1 TetR family transcriptional regulator [Actinomycetota bacterium]